MSVDQEHILEDAKRNAQEWLDSFKTDGKPNVEEIQKHLNDRVFEGKPVTALVAKSPKEAIEVMRSWAEEQIRNSDMVLTETEKKDYINNLFKDSYNCIWDYYLMAFYESACKNLPNKDFEGAEFIYQSLLPAFKAGLGYIINLGPLIVGVCLPEAHRDDQARIHKHDGPAIVWGDDKQYWWHGVQIPEEWIEDTASVDVSLCLTHQNLEQRRALCEIIGWDKVVDTLDPDVLDTDPDPQIGVLLQADIPDHGPQKFLRVVEEATGRRFCILAPDNVNTALDAQAEINQIPKELFRMGYIRS